MLNFYQPVERKKPRVNVNQSINTSIEEAKGGRNPLKDVNFGSNVPKPSNGTKPSNSPKASTASNTLNFAGKGIGEKKSLLPPLGKIKNHSDASKLNLVLVSNYLLIIEGHLKRTKVRRSRTNR